MVVCSTRNVTNGVGHMHWRELIDDLALRLADGDFIKGVSTFLGALCTAGVGMMARISDDVKKGRREKLLSVDLWVEVPAWFMMALITVGVSAYYELPGSVGAGLGTFFGYVGPRVIDIWLSSKKDK
jgi:hypothetical protein